MAASEVATAPWGRLPARTSAEILEVLGHVLDRADGLLAGALALTARYVAQRRQIGCSLAEFQAVAQQIADVFIVSRLTALAAEEVVRRLDAGQDASEDLAIAGAWVAERVPAALQTCHHLNGGVGVDKTYPLGAYFSGGLEVVRDLGGAWNTLQAMPATETGAKNAELGEEHRAFKERTCATSRPWRARTIVRNCWSIPPARPAGPWSATTWWQPGWARSSPPSSTTRRRCPAKFFL